VRLFDVIVPWNRQAASAEGAPPLGIASFADELPVIALTCIDPRLNPVFPTALGLLDE